jgi:hypothetical protein
MRRTVLACLALLLTAVAPAAAQPAFAPLGMVGASPAGDRASTLVWADADGALHVLRDDQEPAEATSVPGRAGCVPAAVHLPEVVLHCAGPTVDGFATGTYTLLNVATRAFGDDAAIRSVVPASPDHEHWTDVTALGASFLEVQELSIEYHVDGLWRDRVSRRSGRIASPVRDPRRVEDLDDPSGSRPLCRTLVRRTSGHGRQRMPWPAWASGPWLVERQPDVSAWSRFAVAAVHGASVSARSSRSTRSS